MLLLLPWDQLLAAMLLITGDVTFFSSGGRQFFRDLRQLSDCFIVNKVSDYRLLLFNLHIKGISIIRSAFGPINFRKEGFYCKRWFGLINEQRHGTNYAY